MIGMSVNKGALIELLVSAGECWGEGCRYSGVVTASWQWPDEAAEWNCPDETCGAWNQRELPGVDE